ncbi:HD domain-containing protein [Saccharothrix xinjiangensis]|uniref:Caspase domain-containing protein n=1 Tax=Saccharothrix xinjiangensis TaxID=204798 RepID=A0ABV9Y066_9PSEU
MGGFRALLVGVPHYDDEGIPPLPFIEPELAQLGRTLDSAGYEVVVHDHGKTDGDRIDQAVERFCRDAGPGENLLILVSGHGMHRNGLDYLIPSSANTQSRKFAEKCVPIDFKEHVEGSRCGDVLVIVDACREGMHLQEKGPYYGAEWSEGKKEAVAGRAVAYLYACSAGEYARYVDTELESYSILTRAFTEVATGGTGPARLDAVMAAVREKVEELSARHGLPPQRVQLFGDVGRTGQFVVFDRPDGAGADGGRSWLKAVQEHPAWRLAAQDDEVKEATGELVGRWAGVAARCAPALAEDPWWDDELAVRTSDRLGWLLTHVINEGKLALSDGTRPLSASEAALLVVFPFAHQAFWAAHTASAVFEDPEFERFAQNYPRLLQRIARATERGEPRAVADIRWWLRHRRLANRGDLYEPSGVVAALGALDTDNRLLAENLTPWRLGRLFRSQRMTPSEVVRSDAPTALKAECTLATATPQEQHLREQVMALLLGVARLLAIDPADLPPVVAEHLGIADGVDLEQLRATVQGSSWVRPRRSRTCVLNAECAHQAVDHALVEHTARVTTTLQQIDTLDITALEDLPAHASADEVRAARLPTGRYAYDGQGFQFRLADDRIQELLMGKQLYGDPDLAVRELYQNALDACRYRRARSEHLRLAGRQGAIRFEQGVDELGRPYLDCVDNGIGMGRRELTEVFSNAGVRFADLPEFIEEKAAWDREGIEFHANSRFGIGVLSYFMIADEMTVTTCRLDRRGRPGKLLEVHVPGPGALSRIQDLGPGADAGTRVRLLLRPDHAGLSCVQVLTSVLWLSEFAVDAVDRTRQVSWAPGVLFPATLTTRKANPRDPEPIVLPSSPAVWWCNTRGAILADGIWAGEDSDHVVVDLVGARTPKLTVDRREMVGLDQHAVDRLIAGGVADLVAHGARFHNHAWLEVLARRRPGVADAIVELASSEGVPWQVGDTPIDLRRTGCFLGDLPIFGGLFSRQADGEVPDLPEAILRWRLTRWVRDGLIPGLTCEPDALPVARPSDTRLLAVYPDQGVRLPATAFPRSQGAEWLPIKATVPLGHVVTVARRLERTPEEVAERLTAFGYAVASIPPSTVISSEDLRLMSQDLDGVPPWLPPDEVVPLGHLLDSATRFSLPTTEIGRRLGLLGYEAPPAELATALVPGDEVLLRRQPGGTYWLRSGETVPISHVARKALETGRAAADVVARLRFLGYRVPHLSATSEVMDEDLAMLSEVDQRQLATGEVSPTAIAVAAEASGRSIHEVAERFAALGYRVPEHVRSLPDTLYDLLRRALPNTSGTTPIGGVVAAALATGISTHDAVSRLGAIGYRVADFDHGVPPTPEDVFLLSRDLDGLAPWLSADTVPPGHVLRAARNLRWTVHRVVDRLTRFGHRCDVIDADVSPSHDDLRLISGDLDGAAPWLDLGTPVTVRHLLRAATALRKPVHEVAERLFQLGFQLPEGIRPSKG